MKSNDFNHQSQSQNNNEIIELNVGGCSYTTSRTTIDSYPHSMLVNLISNGLGRVPTAIDTKKRIFIDRDGPLFRHILNFLRDKRLSLPENFAEHSQLRQEADFYGIEPIVTYLDSVFYSGTAGSSKKNSLISGSMQSLVSTTSSSTSNESDNKNNNKSPVYFTIVSKLYQGSLESYIGCIKVLGTLIELDVNSKKFMKYLTITKGLDSFVCECKFIHEDKIICCKPCGLNATSGSGDQKLIGLCQSVVRVAKQFGMTTGYWEDMFYLCVDQSAPNREQLSSILNEKHNAKLLSSCMCDSIKSKSSSSYASSDEHGSKNSLVERWHIAPKKTKSKE